MVVDTQRLRVGYGCVVIRNSQQQQWHAFSYHHNALLWLLLTDFQVLLLLYRMCFWAGDMFAPKLHMCDGILIQSFLQDAFLDMWDAVMHAVGNLNGVPGFEVCWYHCQGFGQQL